MYAQSYNLRMWAPWLCAHTSAVWQQVLLPWTEPVFSAAATVGAAVAPRWSPRVGTIDRWNAQQKTKWRLPVQAWPKMDHLSTQHSLMCGHLMPHMNINCIYKNKWSWYILSDNERLLLSSRHSLAHLTHFTNAIMTSNTHHDITYQTQLNLLFK